jgi:flagellar hook-associated protein 2
MATGLASTTGLASGIDTKALTEQLLFLDRAPARLAEANSAKAQARLDSVKAMNTRILAARDAIDKVTTASSFTAKRITSSNTTALDASVSSTAMPGGMTISVKALASAHQVVSTGQTLSTTDLGAGTLTFRIASATADVVITPTTNTMAGLAEAINASNQGLSASVVNDGSGTPYRLVVNSTKTGAANAITSLVGSGGFAALVPNLGAMQQITAAADAEIRLGNPTTGLKLNSASNTMDQAVPGVTLSLKAIADNIDVTVSQDAASTRSTVQGLIDAVNSAQDYYSSNSRFDVATKIAGALFGDYDLRSKLGDVQRELAKTFSAQPSGFQSLADIGVTSDGSGKMSLNATVFDAKLAENPTAVSNLFTAASAAAYKPLETLTRSVDGTMALKQTGIEDQIKSYAERIAAVDARQVQRQAYYQAKFLAMEKTIASMKSQGDSLNGFITGLNKSSK